MDAQITPSKIVVVATSFMDALTESDFKRICAFMTPAAHVAFLEFISSVTDAAVDPSATANATVEEVARLFVESIDYSTVSKILDHVAPTMRIAFMDILSLAAAPDRKKHDRKLN